jgi:ABC-type amino acid transport substrate-binding protein
MAHWNAFAQVPWIMDVIDVVPYGFTLHSGVVSGVGADFAQALSKLSAHPIETRLVPIARAIQNINKSASDLTVLLPVPGFASDVKAIARMTQLEVEVLPRKGLTIDSTAALQGLRIASLSGGAGYGMIADLQGVVHHRSNTLSSMLQLLRSGRVDAVASVRQSLRQGLADEGMRLAEWGTPYVLGRLDLNLWASPAFPESNRVRLAEAAGKLTRSGEAARIVDKYTAGS